MMRRSLKPHLLSMAWGLVAVAAAVSAAPAQEAAPAPDDWRSLDSSEQMQNYKSRLEEAFDADAKAFLTQQALPQLALPKNRRMIDRVRRQMLAALCGDGRAAPQAQEAARKTITDFMTALARDGKAEMVVRVNAALFVGDLRAVAGSKPWPGAARPLADLLRDDGLPPAVRIAAAAGLARQVDAEPTARGADVGPTVLAVAGSPLAGVDPVAAEWLRSRALAMLGRMAAAAPNGTAAAAAAILRDPSRPIDTRVRSAAALGASIKAAGETDVPAAVMAIRDLAGGALEATMDRDERRALAGGQLAAVPPQAGLDPSTVPAYRRDAWRLATLADALAPTAPNAGLARFAGPTAAEATAAADALRQAAVLLDQQPDADSLAAAIEAVSRVAPAPAPPAGQPQPPAPAPAAPPATADAPPFGEG